MKFRLPPGHGASRADPSGRSAVEAEVEAVVAMLGQHAEPADGGTASELPPGEPPRQPGEVQQEAEDREQPSDAPALPPEPRTRNAGLGPPD